MKGTKHSTNAGFTSVRSETLACAFSACGHAPKIPQHRSKGSAGRSQSQKEKQRGWMRLWRGCCRHLPSQGSVSSTCLVVGVRAARAG